MKMLLVLASVVVAGVVISGCQNSNPGESTDLDTGSVSLENSGSNNQQLNQNSLNQASSSSQFNPLSKGTMKQLSDFEQIPATQATIVTNKGEITFELFRDQAPITTANFLNLAKSGFYDGIVFHRVIPDFMAQVGDPLTKDPSKQAMWGSGGPGYTIPDEFDPNLKHDSEGIVSMANAGPNTGGSQIFITYGPTPHLNGVHSIFGKVTQGMDVLRTIEIGDRILSVKYQ